MALMAEQEGFGLDGGTRAISLSERFVAPPFSVLDTRQGYWQERRRAWLALGIQSELGRGIATTSGNARSDYGAYAATARAYRQDLMRHEVLPGSASAFSVGKLRDGGSVGAQGAADNQAPGTSLFDPVLCEVVYRWFAPDGGTVLDPFAGGSVRGIVAAYLGHPYTGIDLSGRQIEANRAQLEIVPPDRPVPVWVVGDSADILPRFGAQYDLVFSCPPYHDLEVYSDDPADLSAMDWLGFVEAYRTIIGLAVDKLEDSRFAVFVVSEVRGPTGHYRGLVHETVRAFEDAGARFYNDIILINSAGSLPVRAGRYMDSSRKVGRTHQNVLVFLKGGAPREWSYERPAPADPQPGLWDLEA